MVPRLALAAVLLMTVAGCSSLGVANSDPGTLEAPPVTLQLGEGIVAVQNIAYIPADVTVPAGTEVVWMVDDGGVGHTITADDGSFGSDRLTEGEFRHTFGAPGRYAYHCEIHARMKGTVLVQ